MAIEIAKSSDEDVQSALTQAYTEKKLRGKKLVAVRKIIEQRRRRGKHLRDTRFAQRDGQGVHSPANLSFEFIDRKPTAKSY